MVALWLPAKFRTVLLTDHQQLGVHQRGFGVDVAGRHEVITAGIDGVRLFAISLHLHGNTLHIDRMPLLIVGGG